MPRLILHQFVDLDLCSLITELILKNALQFFLFSQSCDGIELHSEILLWTMLHIFQACCNGLMCCPQTQTATSSSPNWQKTFLLKLFYHLMLWHLKWLAEVLWTSLVVQKSFHRHKLSQQGWIYGIFNILDVFPEKSNKLAPQLHFPIKTQWHPLNTLIILVTTELQSEGAFSHVQLCLCVAEW